MKSVWLDTAEKPKFDPLDGDVQTDVLIVGGGLTGILCAHMLQAAGVDYVLVEADQICGGITKNTTAKVTLQHGLIYDKIRRKYGLDSAKTYYTANHNALVRYRELCKKLDCQFEVRDAYVYSHTDPQELEAEVKAYHAMDVQAEFTEKTTLPFAVAGAVKVKEQGQIHPLEFLYKLAKGLNIRENTKLLQFSPHCAQTDRGSIRFNKAIVVTHFPMLNKHGFYFLKLYQHRSYVLALKNAQQVDGMYIDADMKGLSFRNYGDLLLLGGGSHRTGKQGGGYAELIDVAQRYYPKATVETRFATQDCMSLDGIPYVGQYGKNTPDLFVATGYNKWGFTSAMAAAEILCDQVQGKPNPYSELFSPARPILQPQLAVNGIETTLNLLTPTVPRCPHLGCALKYNKQEHTWDCPCHGSRFTEDGKLIDNPATDDKQL